MAHELGLMRVDAHDTDIFILLDLTFMLMHHTHASRLRMQIKLPLYWRVLFCRLVALVPALVAALASTSQPTQLDDITEWGNIVASVCVPFSIIPMLKFTACRSLMGVRTTEQMLFISYFIYVNNARWQSQYLCHC